MTLQEVLAELKELGTEQNRKVYSRHGTQGSGPTYGVSHANLGVMRKRIKIDHDLALRLWDEGSYEARFLACAVADPAQINAELLNRWVGQVPDYGVADAFGGLASRTGLGRELARSWIKDQGEYVQRCGWNTLAAAMKDGTDGLTTAECEALLIMIEQRIHKALNRAREGMNYGLIALGVFKPMLRDKVLAAADRIGPVDIDHGQTSCKTHDAKSYILKAVTRREKP